ncbi:type II toxin-antitoxin system RelE/ParE family toxin [Nocardia cyriacigeorgica]|uniref:type II toxin-antitoxin system RelE/ParE family toxin n=1 Tax=Nocardia cyriacigeorgica TaxID=135487 RepID=UPI001E444EF2|nr:type II toxin-antitoxin system RelE/ParE family toxin [Nocardia cyriacigeorgica]
MDMFDIEVEPEVRAWLESLSDEHYGRAMYRAEMLAESAGTLGEPYSRHLDGKVRELRFSLDGRPVRITYWWAPQRRVILLTVFYKTRQRESAQVERAVLTQKECEAEHGHATEVFERKV